MNINHQITELREYLLSKGYTNGALKRYTSTWQELTLHAQDFSVEHLTPDFFKFVYQTLPHQSKIEEKRFLRGTKLLESFILQKQVALCSKRKKDVHLQYNQIRERYSSYLIASGQTKRSITTKLSRLDKFLSFIASCKIEDISNITVDDILLFLDHLENKTSNLTTRSNILYTVRDFLHYCVENRLVSHNLPNLIKTVNSGMDEKLPSYFTIDEVNQVLKAVDRSTQDGKKDYLILILAAKLGLRSSDIISIELDDINWNKNTLEFNQQKTKTSIQLPLTEDVQFSLIDYIKNSRPQTNSKKIFVRNRAPIQPYETTSTIHKIVTKYMIKAGVNINDKHHGPHALRHSLASSLLEEQTPLPVIAAALGHNSTKNTSRYLKIDINLLRCVALEVPSL